jgi:hypothetical protein
MIEVGSNVVVSGRFNCVVTDLFYCDGIHYAEVRPVDFEGFTREIPVELLEEGGSCNDN